MKLPVTYRRKTAEPARTAEIALAVPAVTRERAATCAECPKLMPGTNRCEIHGCLSLKRLAAEPVCKEWRA